MTTIMSSLVIKVKGRSNSPADDSVAIQNYGRLNAAPSKIRMGQAHSKQHNGKKITPYAWIYRWESEQEFVLKPEDQQLHILVETLTMDPTKPTHKYLKKHYGKQTLHMHILQSGT